jgi:hypothetical protein
VIFFGLFAGLGKGTFASPHRIYTLHHHHHIGGGGNIIGICGEKLF